MYSRHSADTISRWRVSVEPRDATAWGPEQVVDQGAPTSYTNLYRAGAVTASGCMPSSAARAAILISSSQDDEGET